MHSHRRTAVVLRFTLISLVQQQQLTTSASAGVWPVARFDAVLLLATADGVATVTPLTAIIGFLLPSGVVGRSTAAAVDDVGDVLDAVLQPW